MEHLGALAPKFPANAEVHFRLGVLAELQARPKAAQAAYVVALELDKHHIGSLMNLAALVVADGEIDRAKQLFARLLAAPRASVELSRRERQRIERWLLEASRSPSAGDNGAASNSGGG